MRNTATEISTVLTTRCRAAVKFSIGSEVKDGQKISLKINVKTDGG
jgi:hypothetical protein